MNVYNDKRLSKILGYIKRHRPQMRDHIDRIAKTQYKMKRKTFDFYPKSSTTWGEFSVTLAWDFFTWSAIDQEANLIHEAQHCLDITKLGTARYFVEYNFQQVTKGYDKNKFEVGAEVAEAYYLHGK